MHLSKQCLTVSWSLGWPSHTGGWRGEEAGWWREVRLVPEHIIIYQFAKQLKSVKSGADAARKTPALIRPLRVM